MLISKKIRKMPLDHLTPEEQNIIKKVATGAMVAIVGGLIRFLLAKTEPINERIRIFMAGVLLGTLAAFIFRNVEMNTVAKEVIIGGLSAFASTVYPVLEKWFLKYINKKKEDVPPRNDV